MTAEEAEKMNKPPKEIVFWDGIFFLFHSFSFLVILISFIIIYIVLFILFCSSVTSDESQYRQFERRRQTLSAKSSSERDRQLYERQKEKLGDLIYARDDTLVQGAAHRPKDEDLDKLIDAMEKERRRPFSRPRPLKDEDDEEITFINERNRKYNLKLNRAFGTYLYFCFCFCFYFYFFYFYSFQFVIFLPLTHK